MPAKAKLLRPSQELNLLRRVQKLTSILDVAKALTAARNLDTLLPLILSEAAKVVEADRCSLFILDHERGELWSKVAQGATQEIRVKLGNGIAGSVAKTGEIINLEDAYEDARFNRSFDQAQNYKTRAVLCVPMRGNEGTMVGVLQALNKKNGGSFTDEDEELLLALGGQAAGALESTILHEEINRLFEGFVSASVVAIEARDPTTAGHSSRVAALTLALARAVEKTTHGPYAGTSFTQREIQELRYASLLHDFGKVGVREAVLVKAEKLYPHELETLRTRFELARKDRELESYKRRLDQVAKRGDRQIPQINAEEDARLATHLKELDDTLEFVQQCNRPTVLTQGGFERLKELSKTSYRDSRGYERRVLVDADVQCLSIPKGSLSNLERKEIESHVTHTFRFLSQIPWTRALRRVPEIAYMHHEKLDGTGYPRQVRAAQIPVQSKMMAVSDIYDALTASDRPYKKAVPHALALDILKKEVETGQLDRVLLEIFIEAEIPQRALKLS